MQIEVKGRNLPVTDELRECVTRRFEKVDKQVSTLAVLEVELCEERNPANPDSQIAEATLHLKGTTLRAREASRDLKHSINLDRGGPRAAGQAPPRQAARAPRGPRGRADARRASSSEDAGRGRGRLVAGAVRRTAARGPGRAPRGSIL